MPHQTDDHGIAGPALRATDAAMHDANPAGGVWSFGLLTFTVSWLLWAAAVRLQGGDFAHPVRFAAAGAAIYLLGVFAPAAAALALTVARDDARAAVALLRRTIAWDVAPRLYLFAVLFYPLSRVAAAVLQRLVFGAWPAASGETLGVMLVATILSTPVQAGEELGWRGFLLPRLSSRFGPAAASVLVGIVWAAWHLPFFFMAGTDKTGQSFPVYLAGLVALSVAMAWLYWRTRGSVLLTMLMHAAVNNLRPFATPAPAPGNPFGLHAPFASWAAVGVMWLAGAGLLVAMHRCGAPASSPLRV